MKHLTPIKSIKQYCKEQCCVNDLTSWKDCSIKQCYLWLYRLGKRPSEDMVKEQQDAQKQTPNPSFQERNTHNKSEEQP